MSGHDPLAPLARLARRVPGYPMVRRALLPRVRESTILRSIARKLWVTEVLPDGRGADLTAGNLLAGIGLDSLPVAIFDLSDVAVDSIGAVVDDIATLQLLTAGFRPVLVLPTADFGYPRKYGFPAELMPSSAGPSDSVQFWQGVRRAYGTTILFDVGADGLSKAQKAFLSASPAGIEG